jgi:hypothetical protein
LGEADAGSIAEFFRASGWDVQATSASTLEMLRAAAAANPFEPGTAPPTVGVFTGSLLVAYLTSIPTRFWNGREYASAHWLKGFWVLEEYRNGPVGFLLLKEMLKNVGIAASLPAALVTRQLSAALGMRDLGAVRDYVEPLRPARILRKLDFGQLEHLSGLPAVVSLAARIARIPPLGDLLGALITLSLNLLRLPGAWSARDLRTELAERLPQEAALDSLWVKARRTLSCCATRSGAYLRWRYEGGASGHGKAHYCFAAAWRAGELAGLAVLAHPQRRDDARIRGLGIGSVVDLVLDPGCPGALHGVLAVARRWAKEANYDALLLTASRRALRGPLLRAGFVPTPGNIHLLLRDPGARHGLSADLDAWMVTRGDAWSDHV